MQRLKGRREDPICPPARVRNARRSDHRQTGRRPADNRRSPSWADAVSGDTGPARGTAWSVPHPAGRGAASDREDVDRHERSDDGQGGRDLAHRDPSHRESGRPTRQRRDHGEDGLSPRARPESRHLPVGAPVRDAGHIALLARFAARLAPSIRWRTEVQVPIAGDPRSADGVADTAEFDAVVEAETRLHDVQAVERRLRAKQRDLAVTRAILLVADSRHNRAVIATVADLSRQFPIGTRACLAALGKGRDPGGDCLVIL